MRQLRFLKARAKAFTSSTSVSSWSFLSQWNLTLCTSTWACHVGHCPDLSAWSGQPTGHAHQNGKVSSMPVLCVPSHRQLWWSLQLVQASSISAFQLINNVCLVWLHLHSFWNFWLTLFQALMRPPFLHQRRVSVGPMDIVLLFAASFLRVDHDHGQWDKRLTCPLVGCSTRAHFLTCHALSGVVRPVFVATLHHLLLCCA